MPRRLPAELIPTLPQAARAPLREAAWRYGQATSFARRPPDFLIVGAQKAGTTALYAYLRWHPAVMGPSWKEVSYFDRHYARGPAWYRGNFPNALRRRLARRRTGVEPILGEASPSYLFHPLAPERAAALLPDARVIAILRDPAERAYSQYQHEVALGREPLPFEEALAAEEERTAGEVGRMLRDPAYFSREWWSHTYLARGRYAEQLERWLAAFPGGQLLVLANRDLEQRPGETYARTLAFLGAPPHELADYPRVFDRTYEDMRPQTRAWLADYYAGPNERLRELTGIEL